MNIMSAGTLSCIYIYLYRHTHTHMFEYLFEYCWKGKMGYQFVEWRVKTELGWFGSFLMSCIDSKIMIF